MGGILSTLNKTLPFEPGISSAAQLKPRLSMRASSRLAPNSNSVAWGGLHANNRGSISAKRSRAQQVKKPTPGVGTFSKRSLTTEDLVETPVFVKASRRKIAFFGEA